MIMYKSGLPHCGGPYCLYRLILAVDLPFGMDENG